jgi:hypothetical protein
VSGFFGMLRLDEKPIESRLPERIAKQMSFRGPDGMSICNLGRIAGCFALMRTGPAPQAPEQPVGTTACGYGATSAWTRGRTSSKSYHQGIACQQER